MHNLCQSGTVFLIKSLKLYYKGILSAVFTLIKAKLLYSISIIYFIIEMINGRFGKDLVCLQFLLSTRP